MPKQRGVLARLVDSHQARGQYVIRAAELAPLALTRRAQHAALQRLERAGRLVKAGGRRGLWLIVPPEYRTAGAPPANWVLDDLLTALETPYYVGLRSAAEWYGATHHAMQVLQVMVGRRLRPFTIGRERLRFVQKRTAASTPIRALPGPISTVRVSTPEATALDLLRFMDVAGGLDTVAGVLHQIAGQCSRPGMREALDAAADVPSAQRLGFLLTLTPYPSVAAVVANWLRPRRPRLVTLEPGAAAIEAADAPIDRAWRLVVNTVPDPSL